MLKTTPKDSQDDIELAAVVRSLVRYLSSNELLLRHVPTPQEEWVAAYLVHLRDVRGLAESTCHHHAATVSELLSFLEFDGDNTVLRRAGTNEIHEFIRAVSPRVSRASLQHTVRDIRNRGRVRKNLGQQVRLRVRGLHDPAWVAQDGLGDSTGPR